MAKPVPYRWITGLDPKAQKELERNFTSVIAQILPAGGGSSIFDATIDATLAVSSPSTHAYKNLTDCVTAETATMVPARTFVIGIVSRQTPIVETAGGGITLSGPVAMISDGNVGTGGWGQSGAGSATGRQQWDLSGCTVTGNFQLSLQGLEIYNSGSSYQTPFPTAGIGVQMTNCLVSSTPPPYNAASRTITGYVTNGRLVAWNCVFQDMFELCSSNTDALCWNCAITQYNGTLGSNAFNVSHNLWFIGGVVSQLNNANASFTISGACNVYLDLKMSPNLGGAGGQLASAMSITNTGSTTVILNGYADLQPSYRVTIAAGAGDCSIYGDAWGGVTISGNTNGNSRTVDIATDMFGSGGVFDITGPAKVTAQLRAFFGGNAKATLRGANIEADLQVFCPTGPALSLIGCIDSLITADLRAPNIGVQAYAIDAASTRNTLVLAGNNHANFSVASTDVGTSNTIHDDQGVHAHGRTGFATMAAGTVVVAAPAVTANSRIMLTVQALGTVAVPKAVAATARVVGTSFTITSADATDTSVVAWELIEP